MAASTKVPSAVTLANRNDYTVLVYYRGPGERYDRIIGMGKNSSIIITTTNLNFLVLGRLLEVSLFYAMSQNLPDVASEEKPPNTIVGWNAQLGALWI